MIPKLDRKTISYLERNPLNTKKEEASCIIYIDAHGSETNEENELKDSATVFSFAGISGALSYCLQYKKDGVNIQSSSYYRDLISKVEPNPIRLEERAVEMSRLLKPILKQIVDTKTEGRDQIWTRRNFDKRGLIPIKQLKKKEYVFLEYSAQDRANFNFGVYILDTSPNTQNLIGQNIISHDFLIQFQDEYPEAVCYLIELSENSENEKREEEYNEATSENPPNAICVLKFDQLIHLLSLLGFKYTYILDDSCRTRNSFNEYEMLDLAEKERMDVLKKLSVKMKSAEPIKTRKRVLSSNGKSLHGSFSQEMESRRKRFHKEIEDRVYSIFDKYERDDVELHPMEDSNKKMVYHLFVDDEKVAVIEIILDHLKIVKIKTKQEPSEPFVERFLDEIKLQRSV